MQQDFKQLMVVVLEQIVKGCLVDISTPEGGKLRNLLLGSDACL
jgi:hypothetical protein